MVYVSGKEASTKVKSENQNSSSLSSPHFISSKLRSSTATTASCTDSSTASFPSVAVAVNDVGKTATTHNKPHRASPSSSSSSSSSASTSTSSEGGEEGKRSILKRNNSQQQQDQQGGINHSSNNSDPFFHFQQLFSKSKGGRRRRRRASSIVSFGQVETREYNRSLGDWWDVPFCLGLGWEYYDLPSKPIADADLSKDGEEERRRRQRKLDKVRKKWQLKLKKRIVINRIKRQSGGGTIDAASVQADALDEKNNKKNNKHKKSHRRKTMLGEVDTDPCTSAFRKELLSEFGFTSSELIVSEKERQQISFEYKMWTTQILMDQKSQSQQSNSSACSASTNRSSVQSTTSTCTTNRPSKLLLDRCFADINHCPLPTIFDSASSSVLVAAAAAASALSSLTSTSASAATNPPIIASTGTQILATETTAAVTRTPATDIAEHASTLETRSTHPATPTTTTTTEESDRLVQATTAGTLSSPLALSLANTARTATPTVVPLTVSSDTTSVNKSGPTIATATTAASTATKSDTHDDNSSNSVETHTL